MLQTGHMPNSGELQQITNNVIALITVIQMMNNVEGMTYIIIRVVVEVKIHPLSDSVTVLQNTLIC